MKPKPPKKRGEGQIPMCPICETRHNSRDGHNFKKAPKR